MLVSISKDTSTFAHFEELKAFNVPVVFFDRIPPFKNVNYVACSLRSATIKAVQFLLQKGHRSIGLINGPTTLFPSRERTEGYIEAARFNRLKYEPSLIINCDLTEGETTTAAKFLLNNKRKPTAIVAFNDYVSLFLIKHLKELKINEDIDVVSYANLPIMKYLDNSTIASVEQ